MEFSLPRIQEILARTPHVLRTLLGGLPDEFVRADYGPGTWSPHQVLGHLVHGEQTDWLPRASRILESGDSLAFEPFDRNGHAALCREKTPGELLNQFETVRTGNLARLREMSLAPEDMARRGRHPALGAVTLGQLLATWATHDLNHTSQICKGLAYQFKSDVGPWEAYLSILAPPSPR